MAGQMMLKHLGETQAADLIERAVVKVIQKDLKSMEAGKMGIGTSQVGDRVAAYIQSEK
jgi:3-isopropylmalate dehydrogenase